MNKLVRETMFKWFQTTRYESVLVLFAWFRDVCVRQDGRVHLTVVYFGRDQIDQVKAVLDQITR